MSTVFTAVQTTVAQTHHFYVDWTFWQGIVALLALVLSQLPPLMSYFRPGKIKADFPSKVLITHTFGNPNVNLLVSLRNAGTLDVRVKSLWITVRRTGAEAFRLDAHNFENPGDPKSYFLVPFTIKANENWVRHYHFYRDFDRDVDKQIREGRLAIARQIRDRRAGMAPSDLSLVKVDDELWGPFKAIFDRLFQWHAGEYEVVLHVEADPAKASITKSLRFVLFEGDVDQLKEHVQEYATGGAGIQWSGERALAVYPIITEVFEAR